MLPHQGRGGETGVSPWRGAVQTVTAMQGGGQSQRMGAGWGRAALDLVRHP